jgi:imidazolonepropionase-like amidohydrolase
VGCHDLSLNTDAPVIPPEEFFLQGSMSVRLGLDWDVALRALTLAPARQVGIGDRVGALAVGMDADFVIKAGEPLDPASPIELVFIDGQQVYRNGDVR